MTSAPLLAAESLRIDVDGAAMIEGATFVTRGGLTALVGDANGLLHAIAGSAMIRSGTLGLLGYDVQQREQLSAGVAGVAMLDPPLPPRWTGREYLIGSARLAGLGRSAARDSAAAVIGELELGKVAAAATSTLSLAERRALVLAQAVVTNPAVLVAVAPLGLAGQEAAYVLAVFSLATKARKWIVSLSNLRTGSDENALATKADELLVFASGRLVRQGKIEKIEEEAASYTLMLRGKVGEFRDALRARRVELAGGPQLFSVELPAEMKAQDLLALSAEIGAPIVELVPRIPTS